MVKLDLSSSEPDAIKSIEKQIGMVHKRIETGRLSSTLSYDVEYALNSAIVSLETMKTEIFKKKPTDGKVAFKQLKAAFDKRVKSLEKTIDKAGQELSNVFSFCEDVFGDGQEMLILVTELTVNYYCAHFIGRYGCKEYFAHNKELLFYERQKEIIQQLQELELEDL